MDTPEVVIVTKADVLRLLDQLKIQGRTPVIVISLRDCGEEEEVGIHSIPTATAEWVNQLILDCAERIRCGL